MGGTEVGGLRLILGALGGLALLSVQTVSAGLMLTVDTIADFRFDGNNLVYSVDYDPQSFHKLTRHSENEVTLESKAGVTRQAGQEVLYLSAEMNGAGAFGGGEFRASLDGEGISQLLDGSLADMGSHTYGFFVNEVALPHDLAEQYGQLGIPVRVRVANLKGTGLMDAYTTVIPSVGATGSAVSAELKAGAAKTPSIPIPGTLLLVLGACIPLAASSRRRCSSFPR